MPTVQRPKDFLDLIAPGAVLFNTDHSVFGNTYRTVMMLRGYPPTTEEQALLRQLGELEGVTVHLAVRKVTAAEEEAILHAATNKSRMERSNVSNVKQSVTAEAKLQDTASLILGMRRDREPLLHTSVFLELTAKTMEELQRLRDSVSAILLRSKLTTDPLLLRQRDGFLSSNPAGRNTLGAFAERVLPASSAANLFFISYSGKTDPHGFFIGRDKYGSNIIVDLDRRAPDKTNGSALILGNTGQGKSYLLKLLLCNVREDGKDAILMELQNEDEEKWIAEYNLLTSKPVIYAANVAEDDLADDGANNSYVQSVREYAKEHNSEVFVICAEIEAEISELEEDEKKMFLEDLGLTESGLEKLIAASYRLLGLMSFLTAGEDETRAWTIKVGTKAPQAAGKIHTDFERGFIKAEVVNYQDLLDCGSYAGAREKGLVRMEGKDYIVRDGDVILFRFNV